MRLHSLHTFSIWVGGLEMFAWKLNCSWKKNSITEGLTSSLIMKRRLLWDVARNVWIGKSLFAWCQFRALRWVWQNMEARFFDNTGIDCICVVRTLSWRVQALVLLEALFIFMNRLMCRLELRTVLCVEILLSISETHSVNSTTLPEDAHYIHATQLWGGVTLKWKNWQTLSSISCKDVGQFDKLHSFWIYP